MCHAFSFSAPGQTKPAPGPRSPAQQQQDSIARQLQSIAAQQQSIARQQAVAGPPEHSLARFVQDSNPFACDPAPTMQLEGAVRHAAQTYHVEPDLIHAVIRQESGGYPCAVSEKGAIGLMQLMPETAAEMGASDPFDISQNISAGTRFLSDLLQRYQGDLNRVLGAYNAGPAAVDRTGDAPPFPETIRYIHSILERLKSPLSAAPARGDTVSGDPKLFPAAVR